MQATEIGDPMAEGRHIGPLVNKTQWEKVQGLIAKGIEEGATLEAGGPGRPDGVEIGYFVKPTLFRSEEHTSELQSLMRISYAVFCLKKKNTKNHHTRYHTLPSRLHTSTLTTHIIINIIIV